MNTNIIMHTLFNKSDNRTPSYTPATDPSSEQKTETLDKLPEHKDTETKISSKDTETAQNITDPKEKSLNFPAKCREAECKENSLIGNYNTKSDAFVAVIHHYKDVHPGASPFVATYNGVKVLHAANSQVSDNKTPEDAEDNLGKVTSPENKKVSTSTLIDNSDPKSSADKIKDEPTPSKAWSVPNWNPVPSNESTQSNQSENAWGLQSMVKSASDNQVPVEQAKAKQTKAKFTYSNDDEVVNDNSSDDNNSDKKFVKHSSSNDGSSDVNSSDEDVDKHNSSDDNSSDEDKGVKHNSSDDNSSDEDKGVKHNSSDDNSSDDNSSDKDKVVKHDSSDDNSSDEDKVVKHDDSDEEEVVKHDSSDEEEEEKVPSLSSVAQAAAEAQNVAKETADPETPRRRGVDVEITDKNVALNLLIGFLGYAEKRKVFNDKESAKFQECVKKFQNSAANHDDVDDATPEATEEPSTDSDVEFLDKPVTNEAAALNMLVGLLAIAQSRGSFSLQESAKLWECIKKFQEN